MKSTKPISSTIIGAEAFCQIYSALQPPFRFLYLKASMQKMLSAVIIMLPKGTGLLLESQGKTENNETPNNSNSNNFSFRL